MVIVNWHLFVICFLKFCYLFSMNIIKRFVDKKKHYATFCYMSTVIRISDSLAREAKIISAVEHRSLTAQIEYWATIGKAAEENPGLPLSFIKETFLALEEMKVKGKENYAFG